MSERSGVEIDYCPNCRGVWLDRGELDKIIERTEGGSGGFGERAGQADDSGGKKGRSSILGDLFGNK